jgi:hypothetical protein
MMGLNEIKSNVNLSTDKIIALCESLLERMEDPELRRYRTSDADRYLRTLKTQFKELNDRYPGIFNVLLEFGRRTPDGFDTMTRISGMLRMRDQIDAGQKTQDQAEKEVDYEYANVYVRPAVGSEAFDRIVPKPI